MLDRSDHTQEVSFTYSSRGLCLQVVWKMDKERMKTEIAEPAERQTWAWTQLGYINLAVPQGPKPQ